MFYGKPAYRSKHSGSNFISCYLPCVFIFDPKKIQNQIKAVYPFDTGAFHNGYYKSYFHSRTKIEDFELSPSLEAAKQVVGRFYTTNKEYFQGGSRKNVPSSPTDFEVEGYVELSRAPAHPDARSILTADERASAIELHFYENVELKGALLACVIPETFLDVESIKTSLSKISPPIIRTYSTIHKMGF